MRSNSWQWLSLTLCLLAATCWVRAAGQEAHQAKKTPRGKAAAPAKKSEVLTWPIQGWGKTVDDAQKHAAQNAEKILVPHLKSLDAHWAWIPPMDFIRKNLLTGAAERCQELDQEVINGVPLQCWSWTMTLTPGQLDNMRREDAKYRAQLAVQERKATAEQRMVELAKLVGLIVLALGGAWLFIRVDQWMAGTRRQWARVGLASVVVGGGAALWLLS